jgi:hypothetical protein
MALHEIGVECGDISQIAWAFAQDVPQTGFAVGHAAATAPPLPWPTQQVELPAFFPPIPLRHKTKFKRGTAIPNDPLLCTVPPQSKI